MIFLNQLSTILQQGFIYAIIALGVYITYRILDFPDLSVDGTFPLGGVVFAGLITVGCPWAVAMIVSFFSGCLAGLVTGILHVKLKINNLLSGIITMTALISVNLVIAKAVTGSSASIPFSRITTLLNNGILDSVSYEVGNYLKVLFIVAILVLCKVLLDLFLKTKTGFLLRATGNNSQMVTQMGKNTDNYKMLGLSIANGLVALAGSLYCQLNSVFNSDMGTGTVVIALACVIIGGVLSKRIKFVGDTLGVIFGAVIYYAVLMLAMNLLGTNYTKLIVAILFVVVLLFDNGLIGQTFKRIFRKKEKGEDKNAGNEKY